MLYGFVPLEIGIARDSSFLGLSQRCRESGFRLRKFGSFHLQGEEPQRKLRPNKYQPPASGLLKSYESDSSVDVDEDTNLKVGYDAVTRPEASSAMKPRHKTRAAAAKQSVSTAAAKVEAAKTAKLEAEKKRKRNRKTNLPSAVETSVIHTPPSREVEFVKEEDEATDDPPVVEDRTVRRSLSPAAKRQRELGQKATEDDLC
jgi:hypothetical protein